MKFDCRVTVDLDEDVVKLLNVMGMRVRWKSKREAINGALRFAFGPWAKSADGLTETVVLKIEPFPQLVFSHHCRNHQGCKENK